MPVVETFHSLQGEGFHTGISAFFIRLAGCSVGCSWCDTKQSWPLQPHPLRSIQQLQSDAVEAKRKGAAFTVITGGEPLEHDLEALCSALKQRGLRLHLETSGTSDYSGVFDWITLSPKPHRLPTPALLRSCHELKVIVHSEADLEFAEQMREAVHASGNQPVLLLQPGHGSANGITLAVQHLLEHSHWRLSLQTHKLLGLR